MKLEIIDIQKRKINFCKKSEFVYELIQLGNIYLYKENHKNKSNYRQNKDCFDSFGIKRVLCEKYYFIVNHLNHFVNNISIVF